jgi:hypothetical protein
MEGYNAQREKESHEVNQYLGVLNSFLNNSRKTLKFNEAQNLIYTIDGVPDDLAEDKIARRISEVARSVRQAKGLAAYKATRRTIEANLAVIHISPDRLISGKSYLLPLFHHRIRTLFGYRGNPDQLRTQLAENYEPGLEPWLRRRLLEIASSA